MATARRLCPQGVFLPVRMSHYAEISKQIRAIFLSFTPLVEPLSLDEAFLDVHGCEGLFGPAPEIAKQIKNRIRTETGLVASVGVAPNKYLAKLAGDIGKPNGLVVLAPDKVTEFLAPLPVSRIWGVGKKAEQRLHDTGYPHDRPDRCVARESLERPVRRDGPAYLAAGTRAWMIARSCRIAKPSRSALKPPFSRHRRPWRSADLSS